MRILNKMKKAMLVLTASLFCANVAFAGEVALTADMFKTWDSPTEPTTSSTAYGACVLNESTGLPYGDGSVGYLNYADLSEYSKLVVTVSEGTPRFCFNRLTADGQDTENGVDSKMIDIPNKPWAGPKYQTVEGNVYTIDLEKIVADYGYARLNCIKGANWANVTVTSMVLVEIEKPALVADTLKVDVATVLEAGKTYVLGASNTMYKVSFTAPADGFLNIATSQRINRTSLKINGATSTFTNENGGFSKKGIAAGSVFEGTFYTGGTPAADNIYSLTVSFEEGVPYEPITLTSVYPANGGEWSAAAYYWPNLTTSYQGQPYLEFSTPINNTTAVASVKIGEKVYSPLKLYVSSQKMTLQSLPDTLKAAIAGGLIKPGDTFEVTLTGVEDKEFTANKLADQTFTYTLASTACTGINPAASTSRTVLPETVVFSFDGDVKIDNAKFYFVDKSSGKKTELTGSAEGSKLTVTVPAIEGLLPKLYDIVAEGVTDANGKAITYGETAGQLTASYGTSNGYFKAVMAPANYDEVSALKTYTATLPGAVIYDASLASSTDITFGKLNEETYGFDPVEGVTVSHEINDNVITFTLSEEVTVPGEYRLSVPAKLFWSKDLYNAEELSDKNCYYMTSQNITCTILPYGPTTVTPASGAMVNKLDKIVLSFEEPVDFSDTAKVVVNMFQEVDNGWWVDYAEVPIAEYGLEYDKENKNNLIVNVGSIDSVGMYSIVVPEGSIWTVADATKKIGKWTYQYQVDPEYKDPELLAAIDTLNILIAEVEAYQKTLDLTDPMQVTMNESLTTAIADAKTVAETGESLEAVKNAEGFLNSVYVSVVGGIAGPVVGAAEEVMASYENPTDEAGLGAAIQKVYEIYSALGTGMGSVSYTVADLAAAIEAVKAAQEAFIVENSKPAIEYVLHASWNFRDANVFPVDTRVTVASLTEAYDTVPGGIMLYKSTQEEFAGLVFEPAKNDGTQAWWVRQRNTGTDWGLAAINQTRWFAVQNVYEGFKVTVESKSAMKLADSTMVAEFVQNESTASGSGVSYTYIVAKAGMLAFFNEGNYMQSITVEAPVLDRVVDSEWNFRDVNVFPIDTRVTVASLTIPFDTVPGGIMLYESTQEEFAGLVFEPAKNDGTQAWWVRQRNTGTDWGLAAINQTRWFAVKSVKPGYVVTVESKSAMKLADSTMVSSFVQNESTASGSGVSYTYTVAKEGMLAFFNEGNYMQSIKVQKPVTYYEVGKALNFRDAAQFPKDTRVTKESLTVPYDTVPGGIMLYESTDDLFAGLAFEPTKDNNTQSWWVRPRNAGTDYGLAAINQNRWFAVINLKAGERVIVEAKNAMPLADSTVVAEIVQNEATKCGYGVSYTYKMAKNGMLAFQNNGNYMYYIEVQKIGGGLAAPKISVEGNVDDVNTISMACETEGAVIYYSVDGKDTLVYTEPFQVATSCTVAAWSEAAGSVSTVTRKAVTAGFINAPTATITAVDGVNRTVTLASATEGASIVYATSALEEVALTKEMFHKWDGVGADANQTADATTPELGVGVELGAGGMVYGYSTVDYLHYANLTGAVKLVVEGTPGVQLRVLMNRVENEGALTEVNVTIGANGKAEVDFTGMEYVHLNAIKTGWGSAAGSITKLAVASVKEGFEAYTEPFVISDNTTVWAIASKKSAIADSLTFASDTLVAELVAGTEVALNAPVFAKAVVDSLTQIEYAEKGLAAFMITSNQSSVLCAPTAKISYEFFALNQETGRVSETADLSGEYTDTLKALPYGLLKATASAEGYKSTESHIWLKVPVELTPIWTINFDSIATAQWVANDSADLIVDATYRDFVFNGKFRANMSADFKTASFGDSVLNNNFVLHDGQDWELRYRQGVVGLYNNQSGDRGFGFANLKKNQVIHVHYSDPAQAIFMDGPIVQDAALTDGNDVYYTVTGDGNASIAMNRFYYITKVGVYMNPALTQIPDFAITKVDGTTHYVGMTTATKGADIYYAIGHEEYSESQVLVNDTVGGVAPEYATKIDTTIVYGENKLYTEPVALDKTSYVRAYAIYQDVESEAREQLIEAGMTVQIAQPVILYTGNNEAGEKQFTITVDNSEVISTPTTPIYYTLPGAEEALYDGGTITVKADAYGWMTAVAKLAGYEDSKAARRYIDARESYTEKYEVVDATLETIPAEAGDVEIDYSEDMNVEQLGATAFTGRIYFHRLVEAAVINVSLPTVFNNNCYVTDAAGNKLERGVDYVINEIKAAERPIDGVLTGNMAATAAKGYVVNFLNADLKGKEVIFVSAVKGNIAKGNFTYAQPEAGYKVVTNRTFAAVTLDVPAYVLNAEGTAFELVENGAVVAPFQSVILASADICATVGSLSAADGIESIAADKEVKEIKYFTVGGVEVEKPAAGVYIQQIIFVDGTVKNVSVAVK